MEELITSYLLQRGEVVLPGIGILKIIPKSAAIDDNKLILPPAYEYTFSEDTPQSPINLINYIAYKKNISFDFAENELAAFCKKWKEKIYADKELCFNDLGCLKRDNIGKIFFELIDSYQYLIPLSIEENSHVAEEDVLISDNEKNISEIRNEYADTEMLPAKYVWMKWGMILFAIGLLTLFYHYFTHNSSDTSSGNQGKFSIGSPQKTYIIPK